MDRTPSDGVVARLRAAGCVFAEEEARLLAAQAEDETELDAFLVRRTAGEPLEHVLGWAEFRGLRIAVDPGVFVPRRRSEFLVEQAVGLTTSGRASGRPLVVVDLCCGSGAVGAALAAELRGAQVHAADIDSAATACARRNLREWGGQVHLGDLYDPLPASLRGWVDILAVNAPYVPSAEVPLMPPEARLHEPRHALDGGEDGLEIVRRVAAGARGWLAPGGSLLVETSDRQADQAAEVLARTGLAARVASSEDFAATIVIGTKLAAAPAS